MCHENPRLDCEKGLAETRKKLWQQSDKAQALREVRAITGIRKLGDLPAAQWEKTGSLQRDGYCIDKLILKHDETIWLPALAFVPPNQDGHAYLYLHADGKEADSAPGGPIEELVKQGHAVLAVDLRGLGETRTSEKIAYGGHLGGDWQDMYLAYVLDTSYLAMRAEDALVCARFLRDYPGSGAPSQVHLIGVGRTGPPALHAAALEPQLFASIALHNSLASWSHVVHTAKAKRQLVNVVHGALRAYDLPDLLATLAPGKVTVTEPLDAMERTLPPH